MRYKTSSVAVMFSCYIKLQMRTFTDKLLCLTLFHVLSPQDSVGEHPGQSALESMHSGWQRGHHRQPLFCAPWCHCCRARFQQTPRCVLQLCTCQLPTCSCGNSSSNSHGPAAKSLTARQLTDDCESGSQCSQDR